MNEKQALIDTVDAIIKHNKNADELLAPLNTIATLINDIKYFKGASYNRVIKLGRLTLTINFDRVK